MDGHAIEFQLVEWKLHPGEAGIDLPVCCLWTNSYSRIRLYRISQGAYVDGDDDVDYLFSSDISGFIALSTKQKCGVKTNLKS